MLHFSCPSCGTNLSAPETCAGRGTKCRQCGHPVTVPQPSVPSPERDKTSLGQLLSHSPTGLKGDAVSPGKGQAKTPGSSPAKGPNLPRAKILQGPPNPTPTRRARPNESGGTSGLPRAVKLGMLVVLVFAAGGLFGYGVFRYLEAERSGDKDEANAKGSGKEKDEGAGHSDKKKKPPATTEEKNPPRKEDPPSPPRKEEPPPKKEESPVPPPVKEESPPKKEEPPPRKTEESPPRKEEPPPKKEEPPPRKEEPPPRKEEPPPRKEEPPSPPVKTEPKLDERLKPFVVALKSKKSEERLRAVEELGKLGNVAR